MMIDEIRAQFDLDKFEFSNHATDQSILRETNVQEIPEAVSVGEIIEDYPNDQYGPSCLIQRPARLIQTPVFEFA
jgi:hypothetical protein